MTSSKVEHLYTSRRTKEHHSVPQPPRSPLCSALTYEVSSRTSPQNVLPPTDEPPPLTGELPAGTGEPPPLTDEPPPPIDGAAAPLSAPPPASAPPLPGLPPAEVLRALLERTCETLAASQQELGWLTSHPLYLPTPLAPLFKALGWKPPLAAYLLGALLTDQKVISSP